MTPATRVIDTPRLATVAHEYEKEMARFLCDLIGIPHGSRDEGEVIQRIRQEAEKVGFEEIRVDSAGSILNRIGSGRNVVMMEARTGARGAGELSGRVDDGCVHGRGACDARAGLAAMVYAGKLIHELGLYDNFTLWVVASPSGHYTFEEGGVHPDCMLLAEPTNLRILRGHRGDAAHEILARDAPLVLAESHPLVEAAIATYETLFELPPAIGKRIPGGDGAATPGVPTIGFGPGEEELARTAGEHVPVLQLVKAAQFYAAFPAMYADAVGRR
jgi:acetylornithine deacetylase/succinyl-diaminopimelate desuccinylase-like protein